MLPLFIDYFYKNNTIVNVLIVTKQNSTSNKKNELNY
ncbi:hypothetical protein CLV98_10931 [Dyadobacter jejuensis]|uniref:Uncharacterized protein n=1 Tax=Dyadobacter jejuensis TaxID=1082580 RepID=A0A316AGZ7_9BACT|nr:hypothetical protein CLV98_10931 [Dyadobacter jejuensis]